MDNNTIRDGIAEFIGTFMLVFVGAGAVLMSGAGALGASLAYGLSLAVATFTFGHISGAHVNPAVTLGLVVGRKIDIQRAVIYWIAQFAGGIVAALLLKIVIPGQLQGNLGATVPFTAGGQQLVTGIQVLIIEFLLTFFLVSTVFQTAVYGKAGNLAPLAIGLTLSACVLIGGNLTGASLNPARTLGPGLIGGNLTDIVSYAIGIFGGGAAAGFVHSTFFRQQ